jgi:hypothetical protein
MSNSSSDASARSALSIRSEHTLRSENLPFDIDVWYPRMRRFTFPTHFLPLRRREAAAVVRFYQMTNNIAPALFDADDAAAIRSLEARVQQLMDRIVVRRDVCTCCLVSLIGDGVRCCCAWRRRPSR